MKIDHIAIWVRDLEKLKDFYSYYFEMTAGEKYINDSKKFTSYFLKSSEGDTSLELMSEENLPDAFDNKGHYPGLAHIAISAGSRKGVEDLTGRLKDKNYTIVSNPRITGDGYYESVVLDPEGNVIEISANAV
jgi:lactoylglutathione lyase